MTDVRVPAVALTAAAVTSLTRCSISFSISEDSVVRGAGMGGRVVDFSLTGNFSTSVPAWDTGEELAAEEAEVLDMVAVRSWPWWPVPCSSVCRCGMRSGGETGARVTYRLMLTMPGPLAVLRVSRCWVNQARLSRGWC